MQLLECFGLLGWTLELLQQPVLTAGLQATYGLKKRLEDLLSLIPALQTQSKAMVALVRFR